MDKLLSDALEKYTEYINKILEQVKDFDVWYEQVEKKSFPKEWYNIIRSSNDDK